MSSLTSRFFIRGFTGNLSVYYPSDGCPLHVSSVSRHDPRCRLCQNLIYNNAGENGSEITMHVALAASINFCVSCGVHRCRTDKST